MSDINRTIGIRGESSQFRREMATATSESINMFRRTAEEGEKSGKQAAESFSSFSDQVKVMREQTKQMFEAMVADSEKVNTTLQDRLDMLRQEIAMIEKAGEAERRRGSGAAQYDVNQARQAAASGNLSLENLSKAEDTYRARKSQIRTDDNMQKFQNNELRELFDDYASRQERSNGGGRGFAFGAFGGGFLNRGGNAARRGAGGFVSGSSGAFGLGMLTSLSVGAMTAYMLQNAEQQEIALGRLRGLGNADVNAGGGVRFGLNNADFLNYARQSAVSRGTGGSLFVGFGGSEQTLNQSATRQLGLERAFGFDPGFLNNLASATRLTGGNFRTFGGNNQGTVEGALLEMIKTFQNAAVFNLEKGDFTLVGEKVEDLTKLMTLAGSQMENVNTTQLSSLMSAFGLVGGSFSDQRQLDTIGRVNQAITNPSNDFTQAVLFRALGAQNPDADLFDIMKQQELGAMDPGNIKAVLELLTNRGTAGGKDVMYNVSKALNLRLSQAEELVNAYTGTGGGKIRGALSQGFSPNPLGFEQGQNEFDSFLQSFLNKGATTPGTIQAFRAQMESEAAGLGSELMPLIKPLMDAGMQGIKIASSGIVEGFKIGTEIFSSSIAPLFGGGKKKSSGITKKGGNGEGPETDKGTGAVDMDQTNTILRDIQYLLGGGKEPSKLSRTYWQDQTITG